MKPTTFISITGEEQKTVIAQAIISREQEIFAYELNISNFEMMLTDQSLTPEFRKELNERLTGEKREHQKASQIYEALKKQLPSDELAVIVAAQKAKA